MSNRIEIPEVIARCGKLRAREFSTPTKMLELFKYPTDQPHRRRLCVCKYFLVFAQTTALCSLFFHSPRLTSLSAIKRLHSSSCRRDVQLKLRARVDISSVDLNILTINLFIFGDFYFSLLPLGSVEKITNKKKIELTKANNKLAHNYLL